MVRQTGQEGCRCDEPYNDYVVLRFRANNPGESLEGRKKGMKRKKGIKCAMRNTCELLK